MSDEPNNALNRAVLQTLESMQGAGVLQVAKPQPVEVESVAAVPVPIESPNESPVQSPQERVEAVALPAKLPATLPTTLEGLQTEVAACTLCEELASTRTQTVFGVGNPQAKLCFLGEAPGADEDRQGEPLVGSAGQLLDKIMAACNLSREDVYLLNILRCRPPGNRDPSEQEAKSCRPFLDRQLELVAPEFICCLGPVAAQNLLSTTESIGQLRGKLHDYQGIKVVCTYHPAYLLRNPSAKKETWDDMQMLMREMGTPVG